MNIIKRISTARLERITLSDYEDEVFDYNQLLRENGASSKTIRNFLLKDLKSKVGRMNNGLEK